MSIDDRSSLDKVPDYDLVDRLVVSAPEQLRAMGDPLRSTILDLLLERAATVAELATAVGRPKSTVAHHVNVLVDAGLLCVVRTRRVRAIDERFYGRTARLFSVGDVATFPDDNPQCVNSLFLAAVESVPANEADTLYSNLRHARIPASEAAAFWRQVEALVRSFSELPRGGDTVFGFAVGLYPTDQPSLPEPEKRARPDQPADQFGSRPLDATTRSSFDADSGAATAGPKASPRSSSSNIE